MESDSFESEDSLNENSMYEDIESDEDSDLQDSDSDLQDSDSDIVYMIASDEDFIDEEERLQTVFETIARRALAYDPDIAEFIPALSRVRGGSQDENCDNSQQWMAYPVVKIHPHREGLNMINFLNSREIGNYFSSTRSSLLSFSMIALSLERLPSDVQIKLFGRAVASWEKKTINFLQNHVMSESSKSRPKKESLLYAYHAPVGNVVPNNLNEIIDSLLRAGANLNSRDSAGRDLLLIILKLNELYDINAEFIEYLIKRGYDVNQTGDEAVKAICSSYRITNPKCRIVQALFDAGLKLKEDTKQKLVKKFIKNILSEAGRNEVKILKILLQNGCHANTALLAMDSSDLETSFHPSEYFECILEIANILVDHGAVVTHPPSEKRKTHYLFRILDLIDEETKPLSVLGLVIKCMKRGYNIHTTYMSHKMNLLMGFCESYNCDDFPDAIRFLCANGIDVNQVDRDGRNALFYLSENESAPLKLIYDAVRTLIEFNIDADRPNSLDCIALNWFLKFNPIDLCCYYQNLKYLNASHYWKILNLLVDVGIDVNRKERDSAAALDLVFSRLGEFMFKHDVCEQCLKSALATMTESDALFALETCHFEEALKFIERLAKLGALKYDGPLNKLRNPLHHVCRWFCGEQLVSLVKLFCEHGADPNEKTMLYLSKDPKITMNAIDELRHFRKEKIYLVDRLIEIMKPYGYAVNV